MTEQAVDLKNGLHNYRDIFDPRINYPTVKRNTSRPFRQIEGQCMDVLTTNVAILTSLEQSFVRLFQGQHRNAKA